MRKFIKVSGWILFVGSAVLFSSVMVNILMGGYLPPDPSYYKWNVIAWLVLIGIMIGGWKLAHLKTNVDKGI